MKTRRVAAGAALSTTAILTLNGILLLYSWLPEYQLGRILSTSVSFLTGAVLLMLYFILGRRGRRIEYSIAAVFSFLAIYSLGEAFTQFIYSQPFAPWTDLRFIPALFDMILGLQVGVWIIAPVTLIGLAVLFFPMLLLLRLVRIGVKQAGVFAATPLLMLLILSTVLGFDSSLSLMLVRNIRPSTSIIVETKAVADPVPLSRPPAEHRQYTFPLLEDKDIYLIIVESYGRTLLSQDAHRELIEPFFKESERFLQSRGYYVYSNFLDSPTTGGRSWFADATLWAGVRIDSQSLYDEMPSSGIKNLMDYTAEAGYYRFMTAPGTSYSSQAWREYFEYDEYYFRHDFGYKGPLFTLGAMPDQFLLRFTSDLVAEHKKTEDSPVFVTAILVSSHVPFEQIPQYLEDWDDLGDGSIFNRIPMVTFDNNWLSGGEYPEGYTASIKYSVGTALQFIDRFVEDDSLVIIVGDHQPRLPVRERGAGSSVLVHAISKNRKLVKAFETFGYESGLVPRQPEPHKGMEKFLPELLSVIEGTASTPFVP